MLTRPSKLIAVCDASTFSIIHSVAAEWYEVFCLRDTNRLIKLLADDQTVGAVVVDAAALQKNPASQISAAELLSKVQTINSSVVRVLITAQVDLGMIVGGLHTGAIEKVIYRPINRLELYAALRPPITTPSSSPAAGATLSA